MKNFIFISLIFLYGCTLFGLDVRRYQKCPENWDEYKIEVEKRGWINGCGYFFNGDLAWDYYRNQL